MDGDIVRCFCCDLGLSEWDEHDDAWSEHARHSPNCWYLKRIKGQKFIDEVQMKWKKVFHDNNICYMLFPRYTTKTVFLCFFSLRKMVLNQKILPS